MTPWSLALSGCTLDLPPAVEPPARDPSREWAELLIRAATGAGVDYELIRSERAALDRFVAWVSTHGPDQDGMKELWEDKRIAFWVNAYNALVVYGVLHHGPMASVWEAEAGRWPTRGFFAGQSFRADGEWVTLRHLDSELLMMRYQEPLAHAVLHRTGRGSPPLQFVKEKGLQEQLERAMREFLASDQALRPHGEGWAASELFSWYERDFLGWGPAGSLCEWMARYTAGDRQTWLQAHAEDCPLATFPYDWTLDSVESRADGP
jgi:hypothetical protein